MNKSLQKASETRAQRIKRQATNEVILTRQCSSEAITEKMIPRDCRTQARVQIVFFHPSQNAAQLQDILSVADKQLSTGQQDLLSVPCLVPTLSDLIQNFCYEKNDITRQHTNSVVLKQMDISGCESAQTTTAVQKKKRHFIHTTDGHFSNQLLSKTA